VIVGAILTQGTAWTNVERALGNLKSAGALSPAALRGMDVDEIAEMVRPSGYFNAKARKLKAFAEILHSRFGGDIDALLVVEVDELRSLLLSTHGIGPETADSIVLYAAGQPSFVIDAYTRRVFSRLGVQPERDVYEPWRAMFMEALLPDAQMFNEYHALLVRLGKDVCRKRGPLCGGCPLLEVCPTGQAAG
jgi:endonuclease-3 related protein